jgi:hypothetical protein
MNILCPFIRRLKELHQLKGSKRIKSISPEGDIAVDGYEFPKSIWSQLVANVFKVCKELLSKLLLGDDWAKVLDGRLPVSVVVAENTKVTFRLTVSSDCVFESAQVVVK